MSKDQNEIYWESIKELIGQWLCHWPIENQEERVNACCQQRWFARLLVAGVSLIKTANFINSVGADSNNVFKASSAQWFLQKRILSSTSQPCGSSVTSHIQYHILLSFVPALKDIQKLLNLLNWELVKTCPRSAFALLLQDAGQALLRQSKRHTVRTNLTFAACFPKRTQKHRRRTIKKSTHLSKFMDHDSSEFLAGLVVVVAFALFNLFDASAFAALLALL